MASLNALEVDGVVHRIEHALESAEVSGQGRRALQTQVFILQDLKLNAFMDPACIDGRIESRIAKLLQQQDRPLREQRHIALAPEAPAMYRRWIAS